MKAPSPPLDRKLCQVVGLNQNYTSSSGTLYHFQIEDRGPVHDPVVEKEVRRVNLIIYSNYGEPDAHIVHGSDHDFEDIRTAEHNRFIEGKVKDLADDARRVVEAHELRQISKIKDLLLEYHRTKDEAAKKAFEAKNTLYPFLFSRAWREIKEGRARPAPPPPPRTPDEEVVTPPDEVVYPLDPQLRERVLEIERLIAELGKDLHRLRALGTADDILAQTCRKLVLRAKETLGGAVPSDFNVRRLEMTRNSLIKTWKQVKSRLRQAS